MGALVKSTAFKYKAKRQEQRAWGQRENFREKNKTKQKPKKTNLHGLT